jgi:integrase
VARLIQGSPPSYRLYKRTGQAVVTIDGYDYYLGRYGTPASRQKYAGLIRAWEQRREEPRPNPTPLTPEGRPTVNDLILAYLRYAKDYYKPSADGQRREAGCIADALDVVQGECGRDPADLFGPKKLKQVREKMVERSWCRQYVNHQIARVKRMFAWAVEEELVPGTVYHALRAVAGLKKGKAQVREGRRVRPVSAAAVKAVLAKAHPVLAAMIRFQWYTGCRPGELCVLKPVHVDRSKKVWLYAVPAAANKTDHHDRDRLVFIGPRGQRVLAPWLAVGPDECVFSPRRAEEMRLAERRRKRLTPLYPSHERRLATKRAANPKRPKKDRYDGAAYRRAIRRLCLIAGVAPWHPHQLRHSAATRFRREYGVEAARALLGHSKLSTTEIYAERDARAAMRVARKVG